MAWVYILCNPNTDRYYIGSTINLARRLQQHKTGNTQTTRRLKTVELAYTEEYETEDEAREREIKLKSYKSKKYLKWLINKRVDSSTVEQ